METAEPLGTTETSALVRRIARGFSDYETSCKLYREVRREILRNSR